MTLDQQFQHLEDTIRAYNPGADFDHIRASYEFAKKQHGDQRQRDNGDEFHLMFLLFVAAQHTEVLRDALHFFVGRGDDVRARLQVVRNMLRHLDVRLVAELVLETRPEVHRDRAQL